MTNTHITIGGHKVSAGKVYSTTEVKTGDVWIDGKPIYKKTVSTTLTSYGDSGNRRTFSSGSLATDVDILVSAEGYFKPQNGSDGNIVLPRALGSLILTQSLAVNAASDVNVNGSNLGVNIFVSTSYGTTKVDLCVTFRYTKTSD